MYGLESWLDRDIATGKPAGRATIQQRGSGVFTLCKACNERAGALYVPEYLAWVERASAGLRNIKPPLRELDQKYDNEYVTTTLERVRPARFVKQAVTMLLAIAPAEFAQRNPDLVAFAADEQRVGLPDRYQLYLALYAGPITRFIGGAGRIVTDGAGGFTHDLVLELAHPPFSIGLSVDEPLPAAKTACISNAADLTIGQQAEYTLTLIVGFGHTAYPLDFRTKAMLDADVARQERDDEAEPQA